VVTTLLAIAATTSAARSRTAAFESVSSVANVPNSSTLANASLLDLTKFNICDIGEPLNHCDCETLANLLKQCEAFRTSSFIPVTFVTERQRKLFKQLLLLHDTATSGFVQIRARARARM
jgi:hypothetical protein